ncbi:MAG: amidase [Sandaracinaceae bacterium]
MFKLPPAPRLTGSVLRSVVGAAKSEAIRRPIVALMRKDLGIDAAFALPASMRGPQPLDVIPTRARAPRARGGSLDLPAVPSAIASARAWTSAFEAAPARVVEVTERAIAEAKRLEAARPTLACFTSMDEEGALRDARASAARYEAGAPKSALDGVVVPIKEEVDVAGYGYRLGTAFMPPRRDAVDATCVAKLRDAGAIILGSTAMTEMGMSPLGGNVQRAMPRNVHAVDRLPGGSSTGSAVAVGSGLAPVAIGSDGGGSIRIPACFNGLFGIKPTFGAISRHGDGFGGTVDHLGPIGASAHDLAALLEIAVGEDEHDPLTRGVPAGDGRFLAALGAGVKGMKIGVLESEIDAAAPEIARACREALAALVREGAELVEVDLPLAAHASGIGYVTIGIEAYTSLLAARRDRWDQLGPDLQLLMRLLSEFGSSDYVDAQCLRATMRAQTAELLRRVDVLALPTTATVAPTVTALDLSQGFADTAALHATCRFSFVGNLTGLPAGTAPVGRGEGDMPVGLQIMGDAHDEMSVLAVLAHLERTGVAEVRAPRVAVSPLG